MVKVALSYRETQFVKGMLDRGDKPHDIAVYFGLNGARVDEVKSRACAFPHAPAITREKLPPPGPYVNMKAVTELEDILREAKDIIEDAGDKCDEAKIVIDALDMALMKLKK